MKKILAPDALEQLFTEARSYHDWTDQDVTEDDLKTIYELFKWGPTSVNSMPARFLNIRSNEAKEKLYPALMETNRRQVKRAPATIIVAYDEKFYERLDELWPAFDVKPYFTSNLQMSHETAFRNSSLQGAYLMLAARALGFDVGPLSGFDNALVDELFFKGTSLKSNFICMIGHGKPEGLYPRGPRLDYETSVKTA
ncbi:malonic semialdehyde reductase [Sorangium atrum]|uniref:Malonic semialdehyde reductase n=1 Tax=Sorangium atrum TaxID=2995308 RepID=A0ABT5BW55_9BACT|nr:malonic semialdehyde reductase [Sorangium aterium]MDC0678371.1 malonic semialdehyde reductase [Sorangium aterium]